MRCAVILLLLAMPRMAAAEDDVPSLEPDRIAGEVMMGGLVGVGAFIGGAYYGYYAERREKECYDAGCGWTGAGIYGTGAMTLAAPLGVYLVGAWGDQTGSLLATYAGSVAGMLVGTGITLAIRNPVPLPFTILAGSIVGFNLTRRYEAKREHASWLPTVSASSDRVDVGLVGRF